MTDTSLIDPGEVNAWIRRESGLLPSRADPVPDAAIAWAARQLGYRSVGAAAQLVASRPADDITQVLQEAAAADPQLVAPPDFGGGPRGTQAPMQPAIDMNRLIRRRAAGLPYEEIF